MSSLAIFFTTIVVLAFFFYWIMAFLILYHLTRFGVGILPKRLAAVFLLGSMAIFTTCVVLFVKVDIKTLL